LVVAVDDGFRLGRGAVGRTRPAFLRLLVVLPPGTAWVQAVGVVEDAVALAQ
jgi:hypothetical protein